MSDEMRRELIKLIILFIVKFYYYCQYVIQYNMINMEIKLGIKEK